MTLLNKSFETHYNTAPFSAIKTEDFLPAFKSGIKKAKSEIDTIVSNAETPTFKNTIEALDYFGEELDRISSIFFNLNSAETTDEIQKMAQDSEDITDTRNSVAYNILVELENDGKLTQSK